MKILATCFFTVLLSQCALMAQHTVDIKVLDEVYAALRQQPGVTMDSVKYTGDDFSKTGGFAWQQGKGSGWTTGCRLTLHEVKPEEVKKIREQFTSLSSVRYVDYMIPTRHLLLPPPPRQPICMIITRKIKSFIS